ncbi:MAG TPA: iron export ABC transporter permease subunit FetB [Candidatus Sabulitectum sp.]|nr:iron export ABC transporter permease subunit FetB [Candidatus Sabulitectum sp.]HPJ28141.1 iron export ABC transporter permease subunit FetB [Candidatus Sabulitectum sp.]HPR21808.1 iron export ABC transporter permease subunit FetB [Candidatus Sabulitectum sp.]
MVINLSPWDVAISAALILVSAGISIALGLKMEKRLAYASIRTVVQLLLVGFVLQRVFEINTVIALLPVVLFMLVIAAHTASGRPAFRFRGMGMLSFSVMTVTSLGVTITATGLIIGVEPWFRPSYLIPLLGMVLGNTMNGVSLATDHFLESVKEKGHEIEMELALGATRWEAARRPVAEAVRRGMIPIVNSMMVVGVVSLPGMMTGQILAGSDPTVAVKYQIMVMFLIAAGASMGAMGMVLFSYRKLFNCRHQLLGSILSRR